jgi:hypothetical protein
VVLGNGFQDVFQVAGSGGVARATEVEVKVVNSASVDERAIPQIDGGFRGDGGTGFGGELVFGVQ